MVRWASRAARQRWWPIMTIDVLACASRSIEEDFLASRDGQAVGQHHRDGGLAYAAPAIGDGNELGHGGAPPGSPTDTRPSLRSSVLFVPNIIKLLRIMAKSRPFRRGLAAMQQNGQSQGVSRRSADTVATLVYDPDLCRNLRLARARDGLHKTAMKIATWNINGVKARLESAADLAQGGGPTSPACRRSRASTRLSPPSPSRRSATIVAIHGQKGFNGVAILSKRPFDEVRRGLPGDDGDEHARYIEACVPSPAAACASAASICPTAIPIGTDKFAYKLAWMERLRARTRELCWRSRSRSVLLGDYNVIPEPSDAKIPHAWASDALFQPETRAGLPRAASIWA